MLALLLAQGEPFLIEFLGGRRTVAVYMF